MSPVSVRRHKAVPSVMHRLCTLLYVAETTRSVDCWVFAENGGENPPVSVSVPVPYMYDTIVDISLYGAAFAVMQASHRLWCIVPNRITWRTRNCSMIRMRQVQLLRVNDKNVYKYNNICHCSEQGLLIITAGQSRRQFVSFS